MHPLWSGSIGFGLVNIPVRMHAATEESTLSFNQLDKTNHSRIKYKKVNELTQPYISFIKLILLQGITIYKMQFIRNYIQTSLPMTDEDWQVFSTRLVRQEFPKKQVLLRAGQRERYLSFMEKGILRFFIPKDDNDLTFDFAFGPTFVSGYSSFLTQSPSIYQIETLAAAILWRISYKDLQTVYEETAIGNKIGRLASEDLFLKKSRRELSLLSETAEQRYRNLLSEQPQLVQQIPLKYIASYIGVTPQALSRIRRRIS